MLVNTIEQHYLIPEQLIGTHKDFSQSVVLESGEDADDWFIEAMDRLLKISEWNKLWPQSRLMMSLCDQHGKANKRRAHSGDFIKLTSLGNSTPEKELWIHIDAIEYDDYPDEYRETIALHVSPTLGPFSLKQSNLESSFPDSSATLIVERSGKKLTAYYHSRNDISANMVASLNEPLAETIISWYSISDESINDLLKALIY